MGDLGTQFIRTLTPLVAGALIAVIGWSGVAMSDDLRASVVAVSGTVATFAYYTAAALLERYVSPRFGWLVGAPRIPTYSGERAVLHLPAHDDGHGGGDL